MIENNLILLQIDKEITNLFKYYLETIENLNLERDKYDLVRKQVLDHSNDTIRNLIEFLNYFDFQINKEKIEKIANQRISSKKVIVNSTISL